MTVAVHVASRLPSVERNAGGISAGTVQLDAHTAMLTLCAFLFLSMPFGVATASTIRVGNLLGAGLGQQARISGDLAFMLCSAILNTFQRSHASWMSRQLNIV